MSERANPLEDAVRDRGYTPRRSQAPALFELLGRADRELARHVERALARMGEAIGDETIARLRSAPAPLRARLCRVLGRLASETPAEEVQRELLRLVEDDDPRTRRQAIVGLGKLRAAEAEPFLLAAWDRRPAPEERRSLAEALGKLGGLGALDRLRLAQTEADPELRRIVGEAIIKIERSALRQDGGAIDPTRSPPRPLPVVFHCRAGLERILIDELEGALAPQPDGRGQVRAQLTGPLADLLRARVALRFGFPLPPEPLVAGEEEADAAARSLTGAASLGILRAFTSGTIRYRLEWEGAGHRRAATFRCARLVSERCSELLNDPTASLWEAVVRARPAPRPAVELELWPRGLADSRFAYRVRELPAASHPTLAAALARVAGAREDDVVWDPFVGSGLELCERARLGGYARLIGSDLDPGALAAARANLEAAGVRRFALLEGDARRFTPRPRPTLVITNPPMGKRVPSDDLDALYEAILRRAGELLEHGGRMVWLSPRFGRTAAAAARAGLSPRQRTRVEMGGFSAELQLFSKP